MAGIIVKTDNRKNKKKVKTGSFFI
jgi:hypothetical protein